MSDLPDFLLARFAEDELDAPDVHELDCDLVRNGPVDPGFGWTCSCDRPARVLAECRSKRRIVREAQMAREAADAITGMFSDPNDLRGRVERAAYTARDLAWRHALVVLALPHADHPDYREEWKP